MLNCAAILLQKITMRKTRASLEMTLKVSNENRPAAASVYKQYKEPFLKQIKGAQSKELLIRNEDVQVLHGFASVADANSYLAQTQHLRHEPQTSCNVLPSKELQNHDAHH